ncbi:hypothetical protein M426DRAFT_11728 [Hypoxylon sp. CI-4A]|nr:hypothetical protein M426DRAFT_11728 [Hypoxylon sp. CI-4A]
MAPTQIPGYYWDVEKSRYFKIENSRTAPTNAAWSSDKVLKRKLRDDAIAIHARKMVRNRTLITRSRALKEPLMGGFLVREYSVRDPDLRMASFAKGLVAMGGFPFMPGPTPSIGHMCVTSRNGLSAVFSTYSSPRGSVVSNIIPRDNKTKRVQRELIVNPPQEFHPSPISQVLYITDVKYSKKTNRVFVASGLCGANDPPLYSYIPQLMDPNTTGSPGNVGVQCYNSGNWPKGYAGNTICPAPENSEFMCMLGTDRGVASCNERGYLQFYTEPGHKHRSSDSSRSIFSDTFAVDFKDRDPNIMLFGGRPGRLYVGDLRDKVDNWRGVSVNNAITHIKSVYDHKVLIASIPDKLSVFDMRYCDFSSVSRLANDPKLEKKADPVLHFLEYKNPGQLDLSLDYDSSTGTIAAVQASFARECKKVVLYSVYTGRHLRSKAIDNIASNMTKPCVQFHTFDGDNTPSLVVGRAGTLNVYSFGPEDLDDEV